MPKRWIPLGCSLASLALLAGCAAGENQDSTPQALNCSEGYAQILVLDGALQRICGCDEEDGTVVPQDESLACTVEPGTRVVFLLQSVTNPHQIIPVGTPALPASPVSQPRRKLEVHAHAVLLEDAGTYEFQDAYSAGLRGSIIVQ